MAAPTILELAGRGKACGLQPRPRDVLCRGCRKGQTRIAVGSNSSCKVHESSTTRRDVLGQCAFGLLVSYAHDAGPARGSLITDALTSPSITNPGVSWGFTPRSKQLVYPPWLEGRWRVEAKFEGVELPQGKQFLRKEVPGVLKASLLMALPDVGAGTPERMLPSYEARFVASKEEGGVVADREFNTTQLVAAFLGYPAVRKVDYQPLKNPTRLSVVYATPRRDRSEISEDLWKAEVFINNRSAETEAGGAFVCSELYRQVTQGKGQGFVLDYLTITRYQQQLDGSVSARLRVAGFLQPEDPQYFQAGNRAVAVYDYSLQLQRVPQPADGSPLA